MRFKIIGLVFYSIMFGGFLTAILSGKFENVLVVDYIATIISGLCVIGLSILIIWEYENVDR